MYNLLINDTKEKTPIEIALGVDKNGMTTARALYRFLELDKSNYSRWCKSNIENNEFANENEDYFPFVINDECGGQVTTDYKLTANFAKKLSMKGNSARSEEARQYFVTVEEKAKEHIINRQSLPPSIQAIYALLDEQAKIITEQTRQANKLAEIEAKITTHNEDYFTVAGYASLRGFNIDINKANMLGRKSSKLSKEYGYDVGKVQDPRFGTVNTYHIDILKEVFKK
ncbi:MAG: antA/AntB antirepressor family protein [Cellulosilyticum sp.]|nr:antA/AntB antirepressor family protein [Cellulosilyticum sp.]